MRRSVYGALNQRIPSAAPSPLFHAALADSGAGAVNLTLTAGTGSATFTRATTAVTTLSTGFLAGVASGVARSCYTPAGVYLGYLVEGARTNVCLEGNAFDVATWAKTLCTVTANAINSPGNVVNADAVIPNTGTVNANVKQIVTLTAATYTFSVYLKNGTLSKPWVELTVVSTSVYRAWFNLSTGAKGSSAGSPVYTMTDVGNGWYRCDIAGLCAAVSSELYVIPRNGDSDTASVTGDGTNPAFYAYGAQAELGAFASSLIPTTTDALTRNADVLTYPTTSNIANAAGTAFAELTTTNLANSATRGIVGDNGTTAGPLVLSATTSLITAFDGTNTVSATGAVTANVITKAASVWTGAALSTFRDGANKVAGSYDGAITPSNLGIGIWSTTGALYGTIKNAKIFNTALTDGEVAGL